MLFIMLTGLENVSSIVFDFDYTLVDSSAASIECISFALKQMNLTVPSPELIRKTIGMSLEDTLKALVQIDDPKSGQEFRRLFGCRADEVMLDNMFFLDGVRPVLKDLKHRNLSLGIVSNKYRYRIEAFLSRENLKEEIDVIVGFEDAPKPKPDPSGLLMAVDKMGGFPNRTIYVGDSIIDAETACRIGMRFVATLTGVTPQKDFVIYSPCCFINNLPELPPLLAR